VDTAGEELILYGAVVGVLMLLRRQKDEIATEERAGHDPSIAVRAVTSWLVAPTALFAWYIIVHGAVTPGGGFQGGTILAVPTVVLLLSGRRPAFERLHPNIPWEIGQAIAVAGFLVFGFAGLASGAGAFLTNFLPLGSAGTVFSAGSITMLNLVAGVAVATAIVLLVIDLRHQLVEVQPR
jgi:multicomponent Na+:H+ antiporter subunit B